MASVANESAIKITGVRIVSKIVNVGMAPCVTIVVAFVIAAMDFKVFIVKRSVMKDDMGSIVRIFVNVKTKLTVTS